MADEMRVPLLPDSASQEAEALSEPGSDTVSILGSGDFSRSLAYRLMEAGVAVVVGSRCPKRVAPGLFPDTVHLISQQEAIFRAERLVFVAMFPEHYASLMRLQEGLAGKVLVDVSNAAALSNGGPSNAEQLAQMFPQCSVVKGFNTISAWALQNGAHDGNRQVLLCSDSAEGKREVSALAQRMGFQPVDVGGLAAARALEDLPLRVFPSWGGPVVAALIILLFFYGYGFLRGILLPYLAHGRNLFYRLPFDLLNESLPAVAVTTLALVYLPGLFAAGLQLARGTKYRRFPAWLDGWLRQRKQLGLLSFLCAALHAVYSACLPLRRATSYRLLDAAYRQVKAGEEDSWDEVQVWRSDLYLSCGILGLGVLSVLAITSLPSVGNTLTWREFTFVQSGMGYAALTLSVMHTLFFGWDFAFCAEAYPFYLPPTYLLALVLPCVVLLIRATLALPCLAARLARIRRGWETKCQRPQLDTNGTLPQV